MSEHRQALECLTGEASLSWIIIHFGNLTDRLERVFTEYQARRMQLEQEEEEEQEKE